MYDFPSPINWDLGVKRLANGDAVDEGLTAVYLWLEIEYCVFVGTLISNILFIMFRTIARHKI
jgi:hypothetical protein